MSKHRQPAPKRRPRLARWRDWTRVVGWNALALITGLVVVFAATEAYFRLTRPFLQSTASMPMHFVPDVGYLYQPNTVFRFTNQLDFWTESRANSLGFVDREPIPVDRAGASCHIAMIGDSSFAARQVPVEVKFHVMLEALVAQSLPQLDVTTSAFGVAGTGQINQLPLYDAYVRRLQPKLVVLGFNRNDFWDNSPALKARLKRVAAKGLDRGGPGRTVARRRNDGSMYLVSPQEILRRRSGDPTQGTPLQRVQHVAGRNSHVYNWLAHKRQALSPRSVPNATGDGHTLMSTGDMKRVFNGAHLPPVFAEAIEFTRFGFAQFKERARRDGVRLVILATVMVGSRGHAYFDRLKRIADGLGIDVVSQYDHIVRVGGQLSDARWPHEPHWSPTGHRWAAEALFEYISRNQHICERRTPPPPSPAPD